MNGIPRRPPIKRAYSKEFERDLIEALDAIAVDSVVDRLLSGDITSEHAKAELISLGLYDSLGAT